MAADRSTGDGPSGERSSGKRPAEERPAGERSSGKRLAEERTAGDRRLLAERAVLALALAAIAVLLARTVTYVSWWLLVALALPAVEPLRRVLRTAFDAAGDSPDDALEARGRATLDALADADATYEFVGTLAAAGVGYYLVADPATHWWIGLAIYALVLLPLFGLAADGEAVPHRTRTVATTVVLGLGFLGIGASSGAWPFETGRLVVAASPWTTWLALLLVGLPLVYWYDGREPSGSREPAAA